MGTNEPFGGDVVGAAAGSDRPQHTDPARARGAIDAAIERIRLLAGTSVSAASAEAEAALAEHGERGELLYLLAELRARSGRSHDAIDLIDRAERVHRADGRLVDAERCAVGRITVLDDLGRHDEAIQTATEVIDRLTSAVSAAGGSVTFDAHDPRGQADTPGDARADGDATALDVLVRALSNRALCLETVGSYAEALADYDRALWIDAARSEPLMTAQLQINRANVLDHLGRSREAIDGLMHAVPLLEAEGEREDLVKAAANIGSMMCRRGEYDDGLRWLSRAEELVERGTDDECAILVDTAEALASLGAYDEAVGRYRDALDVLSRAPISWLEGRAWLGLGVCLARLRDQAGSRDALRTAIDAFQASDNLPLTVASLLELASVESADPSMTALALDQLQRALTLADADRWPIQACLAHLRLGELTPGAEGERSLRASYRLAERAGLSPLVMRVRQRLGHHLLRSGRVAEAQPHIEAAVVAAESLRGRLRHQSLLRLFPAETASCYDDLVALRLAQGDIAGAYHAADRGRSRSLLDSAGAGGAAGRERPEVALLEVELDVVYDRLLGVGAGESVRERSMLEQRARDLESELDRRRFDLRPAEAPLGPSSSLAADVDAAFDDADLTLLYHAVGDEIGLFVRDAAGDVEWFDSLTQMSRVADELDRFQADGRRAWAMRSAGIELGEALESGAQRRLQLLGVRLLSPIWSRLREAGASGRTCRVVIAPTGVLWSVPFPALSVAGTALIDLAVVSTTPSPSVHAARRGRRVGPALVVGVSGGGVPGATLEADRIASVRGECDVLLDDDATIDRVVAASAGASVLHLASHGVYRQRSPLHSGVRLADGWLTAHRASTLELDGALVVLSACDTGRATVADGEEILGAQYGFLHAGASAVVMSLWPAHDAHTVELMTDFHEAHAGGSTPADALREAQLALRRRQSHPWWWAAFQVSGGS